MVSFWFHSRLFFPFFSISRLFLILFPFLPQACGVCMTDPRFMDCGHTACVRCVRVNEAHGEVGCPCGERQAMAEGGVLGLPRDYLAMLASPDEAVAARADFSECIMCTKRAMGMCSCTAWS